MSSTRGSVRAPLTVALARLRAQPIRPALVVAGVALAFTMLVSVLGGSLVARQQALTRALAGAQGYRLDRFGAPYDLAYGQEDRQARRALAPLSGGRIRAVVVFRELRVQGQLVELAAVDDLAQAVRLRSGRLPRTCTDAGCEMVQIGAGGATRLAEGGVRLRRVGIGSLRNGSILGDISVATGGGVGQATLLLGPSVEALQRLNALAPFFRVQSWLAPLPRLRTWDIGRILAAGSRAQDALASDPAFRLTGPDATLLDASRRGNIAARRLVLVGGETSALLLGFAVIAAIGLRRGLASERRRLLARGARRWQIGVALGGEVGSLTLAGALAGIAAGALVAAAIGSSAGLPAGAIVGHSLLSASALGALAGGWLATTVVLGLTTLAVDDETERRQVRLTDLAAIGAAATIVVGLSRGALDPESVASGNTLLLLILPGLVCFVAAAVLARLLPRAMRAVERLTRDGSVSLRLAVLALARAPARTVVSCAFVAVALGLALFAAGYRATLDRGASDEAAFQVPLDYRVSEGSRLVQPLDAAPLARYERLGAGVRAYPVVRVSANTAGSGSTVLSPTVLGIPAGAVARMHWRSDFSALSQRAIAHRLASQGELRLAGAGIPRGTTTLSIPTRLRGYTVDLSLVLANDRGGTELLPLGAVPEGAGVVSTRLPAAVRERVVGLQLRLSAREVFALTHRETESQVATAPSGVLELGALRTGTRRPVTDWRGWLLPSGGRAVNAQGRAQIRFRFEDTGGRLVFRPREPTDGKLMPVVASPDVAHAAGGVGGTTVLDFQDTSVAARVVGVATRMPTVPSGSGPFVLADSGWLSTAIAANAPGEGRPNEVWVSAPGDPAAGAALRRPPFESLVVDSRAAIERRLASDPLAHATGLALGAAAIVALVLATLGFWVVVLGELRDERSDFFDLEAQGVSPGSLRAQLRTRAVVLAGVGLAGGVALGAILSRLVVSLVRVSATTGVPDPPLKLDPAWLVSGLGVLLLALLAIVVAEGTSLAAFRAARPERASWSLE